MKFTKFFRLIIVSFVIFGIAFFLDIGGVFEFLEHKSYDARIKMTASFSRPSDSIVLVIIDQVSLDWAVETRGWSWPWPRSAYGDIVEYFSLADASSVAFDVLYSEPSLYGAQDDEAFALANTEYGHTINAVHFLGNKYTQQVRPIDIIAESSAVLSNVVSVSDSDGVVRRARLFVETDNQFFPTLGIAPLVLEMARDSNETIDVDSSANFTQEDIAKIVNEYGIPVLEDGTMYLRYRRSLDEFIPYRASQILESLEAVRQGTEPLLPPELFADSYVFFGFFAPGLYDLSTTSVSNKYPGVGVHITMLDTILNNNYIQPVSLWISILFMFFVAFLGGFTVFVGEMLTSHHVGTLVTVVSTPIVFFLLIVFSYVLFALGWYLPLIAPLVGFTSAFGGSVFLSYNMEGRQRRYLKAAFRQYLSTAVVDELIAHPERLKLGGERREISIYFSDVQGFTSISENLSPEDLTTLLNDYLSAMTDIILDAGGTVDKYEGDAIIAFWNAPTAQENHARIVLEVAVQSQERMVELRAGFEKRLGFPMHMRVGLNTGFAVVGNMGSTHRFDYTIVGDTVNLAARLEGLNKQFGTYILCSETSKKAALAKGSDLEFREMGRVAVLGKKEAVYIFEPMRATTYAERSAVFKVFAEALEFFYQGRFAESLELFDSISEEDPPSRHYAVKCRGFIASPPDNWDGVWRATEK